MHTEKAEEKTVFKLFPAVKKALACILPALLLLSCGCKGTDGSGICTGSEKAVSASLKIYCDSYYRSAIERAARSFNSVYPDINIGFAENESDADILIADRMSDESAKNLAALDGFVNTDNFIKELLFLYNGKVIGLPLFLETDGIWLDKLPYLRENADVPCRLDQAVSSDFVKESPMLCGDNESLYWGIIAPLYLSCGGAADDIGSGNLSEAPFRQAADRLGKMAESGILKKNDKPTDAFVSGNTAGILCSYLDIIKIQQDMPLSSKLVFSPGIAAHENESINLIIRADTLFVSEKAEKEAARLFVGELFGDKSILRLISDTHLPSAVKVNCKNHSLPEIFREFYSVLSSTAVKTVYVTDRRADSTVNRINSVINAEIG